MIATVQQARFLSTGEVAELLGVHPVSVHRYVRAGELPARRLGRSGPLRFDAADVERFLEPARPAELVGRAASDSPRRGAADENTHTEQEDDQL